MSGFMFRKILAFVVSLALICTTYAYAPNQSTKVSGAEDPSDSGWTLAWSDEFNGSSLDTDVWGYDIGRGDGGWGNGELQYYTSRTDNVKVSGGALQLIAKKIAIMEPHILPAE